MKVCLIYVNFRFHLAENLQGLIFNGKQLHNDHSLFDYGVDMNDVIQVWMNAHLADQPDYEEKVDAKKEKNSAVEKEEPRTPTGSWERTRSASCSRSGTSLTSSTLPGGVVGRHHHQDHPRGRRHRGGRL